MNYNIFSICTENYKDAFDFAIGSWIKNTSADITIYSDAKWKSPDPRVTIKSVFAKSNDWGTNICRKCEASIAAINDGGKNLAFVDMDCYLRGDLGHVFNESFDLAATKLERKGNVSTGVFFLRNNGKSLKFMKAWELEVKALKNFGDRSKKPLDQVTFSKVIDNLKSGMKIIDVGAEKYNRKISDTKRTSKQVKMLQSDDPLVLHFYNKSYLSKSNVQQVFKALGV